MIGFVVVRRVLGCVPILLLNSNMRAYENSLTCVICHLPKVLSWVSSCYAVNNASCAW